MFAAQLLASAAANLGLAVEYTHRCARWERGCSGNATAVQFLLPDPLRTSAYPFQAGGCLGDAAALRRLCENCAAADDPSDPDCVLFPDGVPSDGAGDCDLQCHFAQVLPWIRNNLR